MPGSVFKSGIMGPNGLIDKGGPGSMIQTIREEAIAVNTRG